jgi:hypothetical protein
MLYDDLCEMYFLSRRLLPLTAHELVHVAGGGATSSPRLDSFLARQPAHVASVVLSPHEAQLEGGEVHNALEQVREAHVDSRRVRP